MNTNWKKMPARIGYAVLSIAVWAGIWWLFIWLGVRNWRPM